MNQVNIETLIDEFVLLFTTIGDVQLTDDRDTINWVWTRDGEYSAASAYEVQFMGSFPNSDLPQFGKPSVSLNAAFLRGWHY